MEEPWYKDGLRFSCTQCGKCCSGTPGYVWVSEEEIEAMASLLKISVAAFKRQYLRQRNGRYALVEMKSRSYDCVFLRDKRCLVYEARPKQCRAFPWWKSNLNSPESWEKAAQICEGINEKAKIFSCERIKSIVEESDI